MSRQGLMDDSGYMGFEECSSREECCSDAYQQGIADERPKAFANGYESGYQQGRADVIEEFRAECESASYIPIGYGYYVVDMKSVRKIAEMLKEQKNE